MRLFSAQAGKENELRSELPGKSIMPKADLKSPSRTGLKTFGPAILITLTGFFVAFQFVNPAPPRTIVIATGAEDGAYALFARRYRELLAADGITLELRSTTGSIENIELLEDETTPVDLAFVQGGTGTLATSGELVALGSIYYEPLWVFYRGEDSVSRLSGLHGKRLAIGEQGSGTRAVTLTLLEDNFIDVQSANILPLGGKAAEQALLQGDIDAAFFVSSPRAPLIQRLLHANTIQLMRFSRATAYTRLHPFLSAITLPEGVIDLQVNIPSQDTVLLAPTANLVVHRDFHPALVSLLLQAANKVHGSGDLFAQPGTFPNPRHLDFPLDDAARHYFDKGTPFLQRYLPFWTANLIDRLKIMLLPLLTLLIPLFKIMPPAYRWQVRKKIYRWYRELQTLDIDHPERAPVNRLNNYLHRLGTIEEDVRKVSVPLSYADELYDLRVHIGLVREKLHSARAGMDA